MGGKVAKADLILHPIRCRIILAVAGRQVTAGQLAAALPEVPQATLYRQLRTLADAGILTVVEQRPVRGTVEKVYALPNPETVARLVDADLAAATPDDHLRYFTLFVSTLLGDFARYLHSGPVNLERDGVGYVQTPFHLSDEEFRQLVGGLHAAYVPFLAHRPAPGRRRRLLTTIVMPAPDAPDDDEGAEADTG